MSLRLKTERRCYEHLEKHLTRTTGEISGSHGENYEVAVVWDFAPCSVVDNGRLSRDADYCLRHRMHDGSRKHL